MANLNELKVLCDDPHEIVRAMNVVVRQLSSDVKWRFVEIRSDYIRRFGLEGLYERIKNRTVATIFSEYDGGDGAKPIASGERNGIRFALYEAPKKNDDTAAKAPGTESGA